MARSDISPVRPNLLRQTRRIRLDNGNSDTFKIELKCFIVYSHG